ncbi:MAG: AAA family ATPase [Candidatus Limnocylindrales bacterium]
MAFLGRERELAQLAEAVRRVAEGRLGRVVLTGPAGIGCTRLLDELATRVSSVPGILACRGRAYEPAQGLPYQAIGDALAVALHALPDERVPEVVGNAGADLCAVVPGLAGRLDGLDVGREPPELEAPDLVGRRVLESLLGGLERIAHGGLLLLLLEDLHHADPATRKFIEALQHVGRSLPVCLVLTYQPEEVHRRHAMQPLAAQLNADPEVTRIELGPLEAAQVETLVADALGEQPARNTLTAVTAGAHGNPLIALELARSASSLVDVRLSDSFEQLYGARLQALSGEAARAVRVLAVAGVPLLPSTLLELHAPGGRLTVTGLEEARGGGFIVERDGRLAISHELCAEAVAAISLTPERQGLHAALAEQLDDEPALAAWHWERAARPSEARAAHERAAVRAARVDPAETVRLHFETALELPSLDGADRRAEAALLAGAARASALAGSFRSAVALMRRAIDSRAAREASATRGARDDATRTELGEMYEELGRYQWNAGDLSGAIESMERALGVIPAAPSRSRALALASLAQHLMIDGRYDESIAIVNEALEVLDAAERAGADVLEIRAHATCTLGVDVASRGDGEEGLRLLEQAAVLARAAGRLDALMRVAGNRTYLLDLDLRREEALAVVQEFLADAAAGGLAATYGAFLRGNAADILFHLGRWEEAERECRRDLKWQWSGSSATGGRQITWVSLMVLGLILAESRADDEARSTVGAALLELQAVQPGEWTGMVIRAPISLALWNGQVSEALSVAEREWPRAIESDEIKVVAYAAEAALEAAAAAAEQGRASGDAGLIARAREVAARVLPDAERYVASSSIGPLVGARHEAELQLRVARTHADRVRGHVDPQDWAQVAEEWHDKRVPFREAKARWWQALAILANASEDDREAARVAASEPLSAAFRIARELPALPLLREVADLGKRARVALPVADVAEGELIAVGPGARAPVAVGPGRPASADAGADIARAIDEQVIASLRKGPADSYGLSPREREVLNILAEGRTDRDIASRLFISERTVHVHVRRILSKLNVSSRTEAAGVAIRQGLVSESAAETPTTKRPD